MSGSGSVLHPSREISLGHWALASPLGEAWPQVSSASSWWAATTLGILSRVRSPSDVLVVRLAAPSPAAGPPFAFRPESRQGDPPNLSILISGGKENNRDALSNGE